jgi:hypothetical protein
MSKFCFFTDADPSGLLSPQDAGSAFGAVSDTEFRVTSLHSAVANPRVFAICDGRVAVQRTDQADIISLILKPTDQPGVGNRLNFAPIKYFIYKGVLKDSLISGSSVAHQSKNQLTYRAKITQDAINRAMEAATDLPANSLGFSPSSKFLSYDVVGTDDESLDKLFYKPENSKFEFLSVTCGDYIGDFDQVLFGLEIVLDDIRANAPFKLAKQTATKLQAPPATANNPSKLFKRRHQKEAASSFMDPCAFFGSFFQYGVKPAQLRYRLSSDTIDVEEETKDSDLHKAKGEEIYENLLVHFANKNAVYIDIRNELNTSINFFQHYDNIIKLKIPQADDEAIDKDYYGNDGWPLLVLRPGDFDLHGKNNDSDDNVITIEISLPNPAGENAAPLIHLSQGYFKKIKRSKVPRGEKRYARLTSADDYTEPFPVAVANLSSETKITPVSQYIRIKYLKSDIQGASSGIVPRASKYPDLLFLPFRMKIPFAVTANSKSRVYQEDAFLALLAESGCESAGAVGMAEDTKNFTLFAYAGDKLRSKGTTRLQTISLPGEVATESHYLNLVRDRYRREKLFQGTLDIGSEPKPIYLKFVDGNPTATKNVQWPNLSEEFVAIVIRKENFAEMRLDYGNAGFSSNYDTFVRLANEDLDLTSNAIVYTTYDLLLEGYKDDGTNISLNTFDPGIKVYSFGSDHNLLFVDGTAEYDAATPFDELPACAGFFSQDELPHLQKFITTISTAAPPFDNLWTKVFNIPGGAPIRVTPPDGPNYQLDNPYPLTISNPLAPPPTLPKGFLAEACTIFTLYKFQQQLNDDTKSTDIDAAGKSRIYEALKEVLINAGFKKPAVGANTLKFNEMMMPDKHIGRRDNAFLIENELTIDNPSPKPLEDPIKKVMYNLMKVGNLPGESGERKFIFVDTQPRDATDVLRKIDAVLKDVGEKISQLVNEDSTCAYKILSRSTSLPANLFLASGDGSDTSGLFNLHDSGVLLFNYDYDGTGGVNRVATRRFSSLNPDLSTVVHLTLFGTNHLGPPDNGNSVVRVTKDGITYVFKASGSNPVISPVDGSQASEAHYDAATGLFSANIGALVQVVARYDPAQRDLTFIDVGRAFSFDVTLISHRGLVLGVIDDDEIAVSINVVEGPKLNLFEFAAEDLFEDDVFALTEPKKSELKNRLMGDPATAAAIDFMIDRLIKVPSIPIFIQLRGNFVGKKLQPTAGPLHSKIGPDLDYRFVKPRNVRKVETEEDDEVNDAPLRYSFGRVSIADYDITITIDSFVSQQWSRLDKKIFQLPISQSARVAKKAELDLLTNYYVVANSDAYVDRLDPNPSDVNHAQLPSYNPILSSLRSFGLAVALKDFLVERASALNIDPTKINDAIEISLLNKIKDARIPKNEILGISADIEFQHFLDFQP